MTPALRSIRSEAAACRAAWAAAPDATHAWHLHHKQLIEALREPAANRIAYILSDKPKADRALRLRLFRPASLHATARAAYDKAIAPAWAAYEKAIVTARAAYDKAIAPAWAAYEKAIVTALAAYDQTFATAQAAYDKAVAPAWAAYDQTFATARAAYEKAIAPARAAYEKAIAPAQAAYEKAIAPAHTAECPDCPWDGKTIFTERTP